MINQEEIKLGNSTKFDNVTKEQFTSFITTQKSDNFAKTFVSKCDMLNKWPEVVGYWINNDLAGVILVTISKSSPKTANLQLLHTFTKFRNLGIGSKLCDYGLSYAYDEKAEYFRVSSEIEAIEFYKKIGIQFTGIQKSGCQLSMFKLTSPYFKENDYSIDAHIYKIITRKTKGSCVKILKEYKGLDEFF
jgi:GNAT superfamily N-acetyltransferase